MIFTLCSIVTLSAAIIATFMSDVRRASLALWVSGLGVGGLYLSMGAELLAIVQWVASTLIVISFVFYSVMFGEFGVTDSRPFSKRLLSFVLPTILGVSFVGVVYLGGKNFPDSTNELTAASDILSLGKILVEEHLLPLEILGLMLFLVLIGAGVIARPEVAEK